MKNFCNHKNFRTQYQGYRVRKIKLNLSGYQKAFFFEIISLYSKAFNLLASWGQYCNLSKKQKRTLISEINAGNDIAYIIGKGFPDKLFSYYTNKLPRDARRSLVFEAFEYSRVQRNFSYFRQSNFCTFIKNGISENVTFDMNYYFESKFQKGKVSLIIPKKLLKLVSYEVMDLSSRPVDIRIRYQNHQFFAEIIFKVKRFYPEWNIPRNFAALDLNLSYIAFIDSVKKIPILMSLKHVINKSRNLIRKKKISKRKFLEIYKDVFKLYASKIIKHCYYNRITDVAIGRLYPSGNPLWDFIPWDYFYRMLVSIGQLHGIKVHRISEKFTSQASALHDDPLTISEVRKRSFSGKRITRGLYETKEGIVIHSDINSAANMLKKFMQMNGYKINFTKNQLSIARSLGYHIIRNTKTLCQAMILKKLKDFKVVHLDNFKLGELEPCRSSSGPYISEDISRLAETTLPTGESKVVYMKVQGSNSYIVLPNFMEVTSEVILKFLRNLKVGFTKISGGFLYEKGNELDSFYIRSRFLYRLLLVKA